MRDFTREPNNQLTCYQLWHDVWARGEDIPPSITRRIYKRAPAGQGKKRRRQLDISDSEGHADADAQDEISPADAQVELAGDADESPAVQTTILQDTVV